MQSLQTMLIRIFDKGESESVGSKPTCDNQRLQRSVTHQQHANATCTALSHTSTSANHTAQLVINKEDKQSTMFDRDNPHTTHEPTNSTNVHFGQQERLAHHASVKCTTSKWVTSHDEQPGSSTWVHIDTGATVSCSNAKHSFHNCREHNGKFKSPVQLCAATDQKNNDGNSSTTPEGEGHSLVSAVNCRGHTPTRAHIALLT